LPLLKNLKFSGVYHDESVSVHVTLENPADYSLDASALLFSVTVKDKSGGALSPKDVNFYIMDEANHMYNTHCLPAPSDEGCIEDNEPAYRPGWLIVTDFKPDFLYQDLRVVFYFKPCQKINVIELNH